MSEDRDPPVRVPKSEEAAEELALEGDEEPRVTEEQRRNIAEVCARKIGDID